MIAKAEKKYKSLQSEKTDMENKIKKLEDDIEKNIKEQEDTEKDITSQRELLENLKMKRRN
ncbi:MAG TPA: hypothetical protein VFD56_05760 [Chitinophagaceae bacterium]|nr:hypothetical protein [Chitinophagaceae bacterium]